MLTKEHSPDRSISIAEESYLNNLSIKDILLQLPSSSKVISNRDFDISYHYKDQYLLKKDSYLSLCQDFILNLLECGIKCKQTSVSYKFYSFPIIKIYSYLLHGVREFKNIPNCSPLSTERINYYPQFLILNNQFYYFLKCIDKSHQVTQQYYLYDNEADNILSQISQDKKYDYLSFLKNFQLNPNVCSKLVKEKIAAFLISCDDDSITFQSNIDLQGYNFYEHYSRINVAQEIIQFQSLLNSN